jgi:4-hydroxy-tetrahydrodipicolinate synthase
MITKFGRVMTAMVTPFNEQGLVDFDETIRLADFLLNNGSDSLVLAGTTGESPTLTHDEEYQLFKELRRAFPKAILMAGAGSNATRTAVEATRRAQTAGVDGVLQVVPYYNRPTQEGLYQHFSQVARVTDLPVMLYNIPSRTGRNMEVDTVLRLSEIPNIFAIKEASGDIAQVKALYAALPKDFSIYSGDDGLTLSFMREGAVGVVSVASHCVGVPMRRMIDLALSGQWEKAAMLESQLQPLFKALFVTTNPSPVKAALRSMGYAVGIPRLPLLDVTPEELLIIKTALSKKIDLL